MGAPTDQRLRVFVSSTLDELAEERAAARRAIEQLRLTPVMFEMGARPHPPRSLYLAYLRRSHVFVGIYGEQYGWVAPDLGVSGVEDELRHAGDLPLLLYVKMPAPGREPRLEALIADLEHTGAASYKTFSTAAELEKQLGDDLAVLLTERFASEVGHPGCRGGSGCSPMRGSAWGRPTSTGHGRRRKGRPSSRRPTTRSAG